MLKCKSRDKFLLRGILITISNKSNGNALRLLSILCLSIRSCVLSHVTYKTWTCMKFFLSQLSQGLNTKTDGTTYRRRRRGQRVP